MSISGHKTRSMFDRYNIHDERDRQEALRATWLRCQLWLQLLGECRLDITVDVPPFCGDLDFKLYVPPRFPPLPKRPPPHNTVH